MVLEGRGERGGDGERAGLDGADGGDGGPCERGAVGCHGRAPLRVFNVKEATIYADRGLSCGAMSAHHST